MKHLVLTLVLAISIPVFSQSGIIGLYVNDNTNEFVYLENDSVWFRINSHSGYNILLFGKGKVERELDGRLHIMCDKQLMFHTATIDFFPRKDKGISIQGYYRNGVPIPCASCRLTSNGKTHYGMLDMNGIFVLDKKQAKYFCDRETSIELQDIALKAGFHTVLKEGHDYVITSLLPENLVSFPYGGDTLRAQLDFPTPSTLSFSLWDGDYGVFREPSRLSKTKMVFTPSNILFYLTTKEMVCGNRFIEYELNHFELYDYQAMMDGSPYMDESVLDFYAYQTEVNNVLNNGLSWREYNEVLGKTRYYLGQGGMYIPDPMAGFASGFSSSYTFKMYWSWLKSFYSF